MARLDGRVAIVTGAGRGIGRSVAMLLASEGASVVVNDLGASVDGSGQDTGPAHDVVAEIAEAGGKAIANGADISDFAAAENLVESAIEQFGRLDVLVNVAGILRDRMVFNMTEQEWDDVIRVHLKGTFNTTRFASAHWRSLREETAQNRIINFTSVSGLHGAPGQPNYAAAKMGIVGLTYSSAHALAKYGVTVNAVSPGAATRMTVFDPGQPPPDPAGRGRVVPGQRGPDRGLPGQRAFRLDHRPGHPLLGLRGLPVQQPRAGEPPDRHRSVGRRRASRAGGTLLRPDRRPLGSRGAAGPLGPGGPPGP